MVSLSSPKSLISVYRQFDETWNIFCVRFFYWTFNFFLFNSAWHHHLPYAGQCTLGRDQIRAKQRNHLGIHPPAYYFTTQIRKHCLNNLICSRSICISLPLPSSTLHLPPSSSPTFCIRTFASVSTSNIIRQISFASRLPHLSFIKPYFNDLYITPTYSYKRLDRQTLRDEIFSSTFLLHNLSYPLLNQQI